MKPPRARMRRHLPSSPFNATGVAPVEEFEMDDRVTHDRYGMGRVVRIEKDVAVLVDFGTRQERIAAPYRKLSRL